MVLTIWIPLTKYKINIKNMNEGYESYVEGVIFDTLIYYKQYLIKNNRNNKTITYCI